RDRNAYPVQDTVVPALAAPQRQKKKEETSYYSERELLRMLLRYGTVVMTRVTDRESGTETVTTVADYIIGQVTEDELEFENPVFDAIFKEITFNVNQGLFPGDRHFVHHSEPAISAMAVDMLTEQYTLSKIWNTRGNYVETEDMKLKEMVPEVVLKFKGDKIEVMQKELRRAMIEAAGDDEKIAALQERYKVMTSLQKKISTGLGNRIIM
ncbi:MAG: hypothetical protein IH593_04125, partial [Bacteroidales bacterium]|nr:hypothetical protein [Bacteroidales bacterium]